MFKPGDKVICVDAKPNRPPPADQNMGGLQFGATYTIRDNGEFLLAPGLVIDSECVKLDEIAPREPVQEEDGTWIVDKPYWGRRFRKLTKLEDEQEETNTVQIKTPVKFPENVH